jgi:hypothetical protein
MEWPAGSSFAYEVSWMDGFFGLVIISNRLQIAGWNCGCFVGVHWKVVGLVGLLIT